jgi:hypothetical protein
MPTFIVYKKGGKVNEVVGANREALSVRPSVIVAALLSLPAAQRLVSEAV